MAPSFSTPRKQQLDKLQNRITFLCVSVVKNLDP